MFTLYGDLGSGAFSAEAALAEAGAPYTFELVSLEKNEQRQPAFLAINPSGKMPALQLAEGEIVTESAAILLTLADHFPAGAAAAAAGQPGARPGLSLAGLHGGRNLSDRGDRRIIPNASCRAAMARRCKPWRATASASGC